MKIAGKIDNLYIETLLKQRPADIHKGDCGRILIVAGTEEMAGAAVLSGKGAICSGSGLVHICTDRKIFPVIQISQPELICTTWEKEAENLNRFDAVAMGPGLGVNHKTEEAAEKLLSEFENTLIFDADGPNTIAGSPLLQKKVKERGKSVIFTPHQGEAERLLSPVKLKQKSKEETAELLIEKYGCNVVIKGAETLVADYRGNGRINTTGNPGMATEGSGDVLTGIIASFAGQGLSPFEAAAAGVFIHGLAGDTGAGKTGEYGLTSGVIAGCIPSALKKTVKR